MHVSRHLLFLKESEMPPVTDSTMPTYCNIYDDNTARTSDTQMEDIPAELQSDSHNADRKHAKLPNLVGLKK